MLKLGMVSSFHPQWMCKRVEGYSKIWMHFVSKLDNLFRSIRVSDENSSVTRELQCFLNLFELQLGSVCSIQSDVINFQHVLTTFAVFQLFTDLFRALNDGEIENHYKMNSENVGTLHGIIISPAKHVQRSREGYCKTWMHFVYKLDNLFRSIMVSDENSCVIRALHFLKLIKTPYFFVFSMHHSRPRHQLSTLSGIICYFSFINLLICFES